MESCDFDERFVAVSSVILQTRPAESSLSAPSRLLLAQLYDALGQTGRVSEALRRCETAKSLETSLDLIENALQIVRRSEAISAEFAQVDHRLKEATRAENSVRIDWIRLAGFGLCHNRYQQSKDIYECLLQKAPDHTVACNNLAGLLSFWKGDHGSAEELIERAIQTTDARGAAAGYTWQNSAEPRSLRTFSAGSS